MLWRKGLICPDSSVGRAEDWKSSCHWFDSGSGHLMCGCSSMVEHQPSKLDTWVRFPSPALYAKHTDTINFIPSTVTGFPVHQYARVAQRWSTSLPRRGSRVRSPSRALGKIRDIGRYLLFFSRHIRVSKVRSSSFHSGPRKAEVPRTSCAVSRSVAVYIDFFSI